MEDWTYDSARDLDKDLMVRLRGFPREPTMVVYALRSLAALMLRCWLKAVHRFRVNGLENLPASGSYILIGNHSSHWDALCLTSMLPFRMRHRIFPAAAADYFFTSAPHTIFSSVFLNALPFHRRASPQQSLRICQELLRTPGNVLIIFPEGTRSATGELGSFKPGIGLLLAGSDVPVLPCAIRGAFESWPRGRRLPRLTRLEVSIGKPMRIAPKSAGKDAIRSATRELQQAVQTLMEAHDERT